MASTFPTGQEPTGKGPGYVPLEPWGDGVRLLRPSSCSEEGRAWGMDLPGGFPGVGGMGKELGSREGLLAPFNVQAEGSGGVGVGRDMETWATPTSTATPQPP